MIFVLLSLSFLYLGFRYKEKPLYFILLVGIFPFGGGFSDLIFKSGLFAYDFYFIAIVIREIFHLLKGEATLLKTLLRLPLIIICAYAILSVSFITLDKYFFRDIRLIMYFAEFYMLISMYKYFSVLKVDQWMLIMIAYSVSNIGYLSLSLLGFVHHSDSYVVKIGFRYSDLSSYIASLFFIASPLMWNGLKVNRKLLIAASIVSLLSVSVTGSRMLFVLTLAGFMFLYLANPLRFILSGLLAMIVTIPLLALSNIKLVTRLTNLSFSEVADGLVIRYSPFWDVVDTFEWYNYLLGKGFGLVFIIPWFEFRDVHVDSINNNIDTTYLTLYAKMGIFTCFVLFFYLKHIFYFLNFNFKLGCCLVFYMLCTFLVVALPYQSHAIGIALGLIIVKAILSDGKDDYQN